MKLKTLESADVKNKVILYRAPYDVDVVEKNDILEVADDARIRATIPTLEYLLEKNCKIIILTYVKRPDEKVVESLRTTPHARKLAELLNHKVDKIDECVGEEVDEKIAGMKGGDILMLENVRFYNGETEDDDNFAKELCKGKDMIVFDGFPQAMREHASTTGIERHLPAVAGFYLEKEVAALSNILENPTRPLTVIIGGAKVSDKVDAVNNLLKIADKVLVGGEVANVFLKAKGYKMGGSLLEDVFVDEKKREKKDWVAYAQEILEEYKDKVICPSDAVISDGSSVENISFSSEEIRKNWMMLDIGPETQKNYIEIIQNSGAVFLAGPLGKFEDNKFGEGSQKILGAMSELTQKGKTTIIAGGDTIDMVKKYSKLENFSLVSLAGGATLDFIAGKKLPALEPLIER